MTKKGDRLSILDQTWVAWEDYLALQAALREALEGWEHAEAAADLHEYARIAALRAQFLDDK